MRCDSNRVEHSGVHPALVAAATRILFTSAAWAEGESVRSTIRLDTMLVLRLIDATIPIQQE